MAIISLNSQRLLIRNVLHVPGLWVPLYSLRAHLRQSGCGFLGSYKTGMHVYFPGVVLTVDTSCDCHLSYQSLGKTTTISSLHYVQSRCPPVVYPAERLAFLARTRAQSRREHLLAFSSEDLPEEPTPFPLESDPPPVQLPLRCHVMISPVWFIMRDLPFLPFAPVIELTDQIRRSIGHRRNFIVLWGAAVYGTTNTFLKPALTDNGLMVRSFHWLLVLMQQS